MDDTPHLQEHSLRHAIGCVGVGLHNGARVAMRLVPAPPRSGIVFRRTDLPGSGAIAANVASITPNRRCTVLQGHDGARVVAVEHLLAAFACCGVDNVTVELSGPEVPVMDGSARPFVFLIECAGIQPQEAGRSWLRIERPVEVRKDGAHAALVPADGFEMFARLLGDRWPRGNQERYLVLDGGTARRALADARGFMTSGELEQLQAEGLARAASEANTILVGDGRVLNADGLRYDDEPVRHMMLDALGDLRLLGHSIQGRYVARGASHALNAELLKALLADDSSFSLVDASGTAIEQPAALADAHLKGKMTKRANR